MIAISSFRPLSENAEYAANQIAAADSWNRVFDAIVYFNARDDRMNSPITTFIDGSENWTTIKSMADFASRLEFNMVCIINSDIVVSPVLTRVERELAARGGVAAMSQRYEFEPLNPTHPKTVVDLGMDIFCAHPDVWKSVYTDIPPEFLIGHAMWDTWMLGYLNTNYADRFFDFTPARCIFHPKHGGRRSKHFIENKNHGFDANTAYQFPHLKIS